MERIHQGNYLVPCSASLPGHLHEVKDVNHSEACSPGIFGNAVCVFDFPARACRVCNFFLLPWKVVGRGGELRSSGIMAAVFGIRYGIVWYFNK